MWVVPDTPGIDPGYEQLDITAELDRGGLVTVASGMPATPTVGRSGSATRTPVCTRPGSRRGRPSSSPTAPFVHLFVARGAVDLESAGALQTGDAARITASDGRRVTATTGPAEILVWEMHAQLG